MKRLLRPTARAVLTPLVGALALSACAAREDDSAMDAPMVDTAAEAQTIMALEREWSGSFGQGDLEAIMNLHASDAIQLPPGGEVVVGSAALRAAWEGMINAEGLSVSWEPTAAFVSSSGDMAWDYGMAELITPAGDTIPHKYLVVWTKEDGEWKVAADIFNSNVPPQ